MSYLGNTPTVNNPVSESDLESGLATKLNGKVTGPASATDNAIARFDLSTGKLIQNSSWTIGDDGSITNNSTGARFYADFSNATAANRFMFQSSTTNGNTTVCAAPNGTAQVSAWQVRNNSDISNASVFNFTIDATTAYLNSAQNGSGSFLPIAFLTNGSERMRIDTAGNVGIGKSSPGAKLDWRDTVNVVSTATTAVASNTYILTTSMTLTLPASPTAGDWVRVVNRSGTLTCVIARNGQNIMGLAENMTLDNLNASMVLIFSDATRGWIWA